MLGTALNYVPGHRRVPETFGWQPGAWGGLFIVFAVVVLLPYGDNPPAEFPWFIFGSAAVPGLFLTGYELWRRTNRTVLVRDGGHILVFRKGRLDLTLAPDSISRIKADFHTTLMIGACLGLCTLLLMAVGATCAFKDKAESIDCLFILFAGLVCGVSLVSAAWTRFRCCHLRVPVKGSKWTEESVLIPSSRVNELFTE